MAALRAIRATVSVNGYERELKRSLAGPRRWEDLEKRGIGEPRERNWRLGGWERRIILCAWRNWLPKGGVETGGKVLLLELKTELVEPSMCICLPDRLHSLLNFSILNNTFSLNVLFQHPARTSSRTPRSSRTESRMPGNVTRNTCCWPSRATSAVGSWPTI